MQNIVANGSGMHRALDLKPSDPIYPCDAVSEQEKPSCYLMQTSYVLQVKHWDLPVAFAICDRVEARYVGTCYRSMGRDISGAALLDAGAESCAMRSGRRRAPVRQCVAGAAADAVFDRPRPAPGGRALPGGARRSDRAAPRRRRPPSRRWPSSSAAATTATRLVAEERALARLPGGDPQLGHARAHRERDDRADERPAGLARGLVVTADRLRLAVVRRQHASPPASSAGAAPAACARRACEPGIQARGLLGLLARERRVEEVVRVREQAVLAARCARRPRVRARSTRRRRARRRP